jgi:dihydropteroate synthase
MSRAKKNYMVQAGKFTLKMGHDQPTLVMGVLNITPDSFSDGGRYPDKTAALDRCLQMEDAGADIIDIGGESSRPGSDPVPIDEEKARVLPLIEAAAEKVSIPISIDTCKPQVARSAIQAGATIINDIFAMRHEGMAQLAAEKNVPIIIMHMQGGPKTMQANPRYKNLIDEIIHFLQEKIKFGEQFGIPRGNIIIDPGLGFGKTVDHNFEIINRLDELNKLGAPILIGPSRKAFIGKTLKTGVDQRLMGTAAACCAAILKGAHIVRVHDVREIKQTVKIADRIKWGKDRPDGKL